MNDRSRVHNEFLRLQRKGDSHALQDGKNQREIARPLGDLAPAQVAFFLQARQRFPNHGEQLQDNRCRDVRHDAQGKNRQPAQVAAAEQVIEAQQSAALLLKSLLQLRQY